jgi:hypothetical protein
VSSAYPGKTQILSQQNRRPGPRRTPSVQLCFHSIAKHIPAHIARKGELVTRRFSFSRIAGAVAALAIAMSAALSAHADPLKNITFEVDPTFFGNGTSDAQAPPSPGSVPVGYTQDHPIANTFRINYGAKVQLGPDLSFDYTHSNFEFALGRIFQPGVSLVSGQIDDRTDTAGFEYLGRV